MYSLFIYVFFFFQAEDGIRDLTVTGVQTCALPISCSTASSTGATCSRSSWSGSTDAAEARAGPLALRRRRRAPLHGRGDGLLGERDRRGRPVPRPLLLPEEAELLGAAQSRVALAHLLRGL